MARLGLKALELASEVWLAAGKPRPGMRREHAVPHGSKRCCVVLQIQAFLAVLVLQTGTVIGEVGAADVVGRIGVKLGLHRVEGGDQRIGHGLSPGPNSALTTGSPLHLRSSFQPRR